MPQKYIEKASEIREFAIFVLNGLFEDFVPDEIFLELKKEDVVSVIAKSRFAPDKHFVIYLSEGEPVLARIIFQKKDTIIKNPKTPFPEELQE